MRMKPRFFLQINSIIEASIVSHISMIVQLWLYDCLLFTCRIDFNTQSEGVICIVPEGGVTILVCLIY